MGGSPLDKCVPRESFIMMLYHAFIHHHPSTLRTHPPMMDSRVPYRAEGKALDA